eukprot:1160740-Pelagomonas_calceolata.AAC.11
MGSCYGLTKLAAPPLEGFSGAALSQPCPCEDVQDRLERSHCNTRKYSISDVCCCKVMSAMGHGLIKDAAPAA